MSLLLQALPPAAAAGLIGFATLNGCAELGAFSDLGLLAAAGACVDELAIPLSLSVYIGLEATHYIVSSWACRRQPAQRERVQGFSEADRLATWRRCLADTTTSPEAMITGWFYKRTSTRREQTNAQDQDGGVGLDELRAGNVRSWLAWALAISEGEDLSADEIADVDVAMGMLEDALSRQLKRPFAFPDGYDDQVLSMRLNRDPPACNMRTRPLLYYAITESLNGLYCPHRMSACGFKYHVADGLGYWLHPGNGRAGRAGGGTAGATAADASSTPLVFVHGVGLGPLPYIHFLEKMIEYVDDGPVMVIELPFVAQRLSALSPLGSSIEAARDQASTVEAIDRAMERHGLSAATFVGHSLGTVYLSWLAQLRPDRLASAVFIDPIVFLLHQPKVAHNFLYARPHDARSAVENYFIKSEHSIVHFFHHHFFWNENVLWAADLKRTWSEVVLSSQDNVVPVPEVSSYLKRTRVRTTLLEGARHGEFLANDEARDTVLEVIRRAQRRGARKVQRAARRQARLEEASGHGRVSLLRRLVLRKRPDAAAAAAGGASVSTSDPRASSGVPHAPPLGGMQRARAMLVS